MTQAPVTIVGSYLSPYVRKVLVCLAVKRIDYVIDPVVPFHGNDAFSRISPVRRMPVLIDDVVTLSDSTVICEYLEERYPRHALYPDTPRARARARWLEEYANTRMGEVFVWRLFNERVIKRFVWGEQADDAVVARALDIEAPQILDYLEREFAGASPFLYGELGIADITVASFVRNAGIAGFAIDGERWPAMHALAERALAHPAFVALHEYEELSLRTPLAGQRDALLAAGAPVAAQSYAAALPERGVLTM